jgi:ferric-dicitrate binding protein FerR (iron transport regulator)
VLDDDRQGHLAWAYDGLREWVQQVAAAGPGEQPAAQRKRFPAWAIVLLGVGTYLTSWPTNPFTRQPMTQGTGPGDFRYTVSADGASFELVGMGEDDSVLITVP